MFKCQATGRQSQAGEPTHRLVTHVRNRSYFRWNPKKREEECVGHGTEVVREILVCTEYYTQKVAEGFKPAVVRES